MPQVVQTRIDNDIFEHVMHLNKIWKNSFWAIKIYELRISVIINNYGVQNSNYHQDPSPHIIQVHFHIDLLLLKYKVTVVIYNSRTNSFNSNLNI